MTRNLVLTVLVTSIVAFVLNAIAFVAVLEDYFLTHPAGTPEFVHQLYRTADQMIPWAVVGSVLALGGLLTTVMHWAGARTLVDGLKSGFIYSALMLATVDLGLLASTNNFTVGGAFADMACSTTTLTLSCGVAAWMLGRA